MAVLVLKMVQQLTGWLSAELCLLPTFGDCFPVTLSLCLGCLPKKTSLTPLAPVRAHMASGVLLLAKIAKIVALSCPMCIRTFFPFDGNSYNNGMGSEREKAPTSP